MVDLEQQAVFGFFERLHASMFGDVDLGGEIVGDLSIVVADWAEMELVPERGAVPFVVEDLDIAVALLVDRCSDLSHCRARRILPLEKAAVPAEDSVGGVACQIEEGVVGKNDREIRLAGVGHDHRHPCALEGKRR
jgi:hypothetical protein